MLLVFPFCAKDREQAARLADWIAELGPYPLHKVLIVREQKAAPIVLVASGFAEIKEIIVRDPDNKWPQSPSLMFRSAAKQIQCTTNEPFFWCEPDCVPMREGWLDDIEAEYGDILKTGKHFLADLIDHSAAGPNFVPHASGICVYPKDLVHRAGEIFYNYENVPFDIAAGPAIHSQAKQSELIFHVWNQNEQGLAPFKDWSDVEQKIFARRPKCALFHSDKTGTLLGLLRERKNFSGGVESRHAEVVTGTPEANINTSFPAVDSPKDSGSSAPPAENLWLCEECCDGPRKCLCPCHKPPKPWADKSASLIEIQSLAARLRQFQTDMAKTRLVRQLLHDAGVIKLAYRFAKRKGWKRKKK